MPDEGQCRSCQAPIVWADHYRTGKPMPLELAPEDAERGVFLIDETGRAVPASDLDLFGTPAELAKAENVLYTSHFATCPDAPSWRKS